MMAATGYKTMKGRDSLPVRGAAMRAERASPRIWQGRPSQRDASDEGFAFCVGDT